MRTIEIKKFTPHESIDWIWLENPHYLVANDKVGEDAFTLIRDAMRAENIVGISRLALGRRERAVKLEPRDEGIVLWTLRYGGEVRPEEEYFPGIKAQPEGGLAPLMKQLIHKQTKAMMKPAKAANKNFRQRQCHRHHGCAEEELGRKQAEQPVRFRHLGKVHDLLCMDDNGQGHASDREDNIEPRAAGDYSYARSTGQSAA